MQENFGSGWVDPGLTREKNVKMFTKKSCSITDFGSIPRLTLAIRQFAIGESRSLLAEKNKTHRQLFFFFFFFFFFL